MVTDLVTLQKLRRILLCTLEPSRGAYHVRFPGSRLNADREWGHTVSSYCGLILVLYFNLVAEAAYVNKSGVFPSHPIRWLSFDPIKGRKLALLTGFAKSNRPADFTHDGVFLPLVIDCSSIYRQ